MLGDDAHATTIPNLKRFKSRRGQSRLHADIAYSDQNQTLARLDTMLDLRWQVVDSNQAFVVRYNAAAASLCRRTTPAYGPSFTWLHQPSMDLEG
jgi:hypothetical protein